MRPVHEENPTQNDESYTYDLPGNPLASSTTSTWSYKANNELLGYDNVSFTYDANGNTIQKNDNGIITDYSYEIEDRLVEITTDNPQPATYKYHYDPFGRRMWKDLDGTRAYFMYADKGLIAELDATGTVTKPYGYKPNSTWTTDPLSIKVGTAYYFYYNDHLGTPHKLTAINGAVVWNAKYSSFGEATIDLESTITNNLRLPGQYYDQETGLYSYTDNRPPFKIDPRGLERKPACKLGKYDISSCDGYKSYFNNRYCNGEEDSYHRNAYRCCIDFIRRYRGSKAVNCVAKCLTSKESKCQEKTNKNERASCQGSAHVYCYAKCRFFHINGSQLLAGK